MSHGWHTDKTDTLLLMLDGEKRFRVASPVVGGPLLLDVQLRKGQALFIPSGFFHLGGDSVETTSTLCSMATTGNGAPPMETYFRSSWRGGDADDDDVGEKQLAAAMRSCFADLLPEERRCRDWAWAATTLGMVELHSKGVPSHLLLENPTLRVPGGDGPTDRLRS